MTASRFAAAVLGALADQSPPNVRITSRKGRFPAVLHPVLFVQTYGADAVPASATDVVRQGHMFHGFLSRVANGDITDPRAFRRELRSLPSRGTRAITSALFDALYGALQCAAWEQETTSSVFGSTRAEDVMLITAGLGRGIDATARVDQGAHVSHFLVHAAVVLCTRDGMNLDELLEAVDARLAAWGEVPTDRMIVAHAAYNLSITLVGAPGDDGDYEIIRDGRAQLARHASPFDVYRSWWETLGWRRADMLVRLLVPDHRHRFYAAARDAVHAGVLGEAADAAVRIGFVDARGVPYLRGQRVQDEVVLRFPGGAVIGRSCTMYEGGGQRLLFDIGGDAYDRFPHWSPEMEDLDAVFITHAHHDHIGGLFHLYTDLGYRGVWYADQITIACAHLALQDALRLQAGADRLSGAGERLLTQVMDRARPLTVNRGVRVGNLTVTPFDAGHVAGSLQFLVEAPGAGRPHLVMISGDINPVPSLSVSALTLPPRAILDQIDVLVVEGTNAFRTDDPVVGGSAGQDELFALLNRQERFPVLLPVMSLGRAQEVIASLGGTRWRVGVFGLAARMTEAIGMRVPPNISLVTTGWQHTTRDDFDVLVASAGGLQGGPARHFWQESGWEPSIIFTGYLFPGTPAQALSDRYPRVRFSGHASAESWQEYCDAFPNATRFLVHYPGAHEPARSAGFVLPRVDSAYAV